MSKASVDSFQTLSNFTLKGREYDYYCLSKAQQQFPSINRLPFCLKVLLENLISNEDNETIKTSDILLLTQWQGADYFAEPIAFKPTLSFFKDTASIPTLVDFASITTPEHHLCSGPQIPVFIETCETEKPTSALICDEQKKLLQWCQASYQELELSNHPLSLDRLATQCWNKTDHFFTETAINTGLDGIGIGALGQLQLSASGIENEAALMGLTINRPLPDVIGIELIGKREEQYTPSGLLQQLYSELSHYQYTDTIIEFFGTGLAEIPLQDRLIITVDVQTSGAISCFFPVDEQTLSDLKTAGILEDNLEIIEHYCKLQGFWHEAGTPPAQYTNTITIDLSTIQASELSPCQQYPLTSDNTCTQIESTADRHQSFPWPKDSFNLQPAQYQSLESGLISSARILALLGDDITTDDLALLKSNSGHSDSVQRTALSGPDLRIEQQQETTPLLIFSGKQTGLGIPSDWAAKSLKKLGIQAIISESFNLGYRRDLVNIGILPLQFIDGDSWKALELTGDESVDIEVPDELFPNMAIVMTLHRPNGRKELVELELALHCDQEIFHYRQGGILSQFCG